MGHRVFGSENPSHKLLPEEGGSKVEPARAKQVSQVPLLEPKQILEDQHNEPNFTFFFIGTLQMPHGWAPRENRSLHFVGGLLLLRNHQHTQPGHTALPPRPLPLACGFREMEGSLPVKLELSFGTPIPSTADSNGGERKGGREERESTIGISHRETPARTTSDTHSPSPTRLCSGLAGRMHAGYQVLGRSATQWRKEADAHSVGTAEWELKTGGKPWGTICLDFNEICLRTTVENPQTKKCLSSHSLANLHVTVSFRTLMKGGHPFSLWFPWILADAQALTII